MLWMGGFWNSKSLPTMQVFQFLLNFYAMIFQKIGNFHYILTTSKEAGVGGSFLLPPLN